MALGASTGTANRKTFLEGLSQIMGQVGQLMGLPDADPGFCQALLSACAKRVQQAAPAALGPPGAQPGGPAPNMTPGPMGVRREPAGIPPGVAMAAFGGGAPGGGEAAGAPNMDEMRRTLGAAQGM